MIVSIASLLVSRVDARVPSVPLAGPTAYTGTVAHMTHFPCTMWNHRRLPITRLGDIGLIRLCLLSPYQYTVTDIYAIA